MSNQTRRNRPQGPSRRRNPRQGNMARGRQQISHPPPIPSYGLTREVKLRFTATAAANALVTFQNLLDTVLLAATAVLGYDVFTAVRVNAIEIWGIAAIGTQTTVTVLFDGATLGAQGDLKTHTDTSMGVQPAHVKARPDPLTQAGQFQVSSGATAFQLSVPAGAVIDVSMSMRQPITGQSVAAQNALVGATVGAIYYRGMDGKTTALTNFPVVGATATI